MAKYLDFKGLNLYDSLIKTFIQSGHDEIASRINDIVGSSDVEMSLSDIISIIGDIDDGKSIAEIIDGIAQSIETINGDENTDGSIKAEVSSVRSDINTLSKSHDADIQSLRDLIGEIIGVDSEVGSNMASMSEVIASIERLEKALGVTDSSDYGDSIAERVDDLEAKSIYIPSEELRDNTELSSSVHGGLESHNAEWFAAQGYTYSQMFDAILFPTVLPNITYPSISWSGVSSRNALVGSDITSYIMPESGNDLESAVSYNLGSWTLNTIPASNGYSNTTCSRTNVPTPVDGKYFMGTSTINMTASCTFSAGDAPKDNKGVEHPELAYAGGTRSTSTVSITPYYNWYATTTEAGVLSVQPVMASCGITSKTTPEVTLSVHTTEKKQAVRVPSAITKFQQYNDAFKVWDTITITDGVPETWSKEQDDTEENGIKYYVYEYLGNDRDAVKIKLTF